MTSDDLSSLPHEHPLRNLPLASINAAFRRPDEKTWKPVAPLKINNNCYNDLAYPWVKWDIWRAELCDEPPKLEF